MRSRLEARVAADFDTTWQRPWTYEPRAFANELGQYLPDFRLDLGEGFIAYVEVKPTIDLAFRIMPRMQIIWDSEPDARLIVIVPVDGKGYFAMWAQSASRPRWRVSAAT